MLFKGNSGKDHLSKAIDKSRGSGVFKSPTNGLTKAQVRELERERIARERDDQEELDNVYGHMAKRRH